MDILSCTDTNFVIPLGVMLHSLCVNDNGNELYFHIIVDDTVTKQQQEELRSVVKDYGDISFYLINIENIKEYLVVKVENFPIPIYYRLLVAKILPETVHKVLYLDADMIIRHDLSELWNVDINMYAIAGVPNACHVNNPERLGYSVELGYFNSGVLLLNLEYIRKHDLTDDFISYIKNNPNILLMPDQDVLNYVLRERKVLLPVRFNVQEEFYRVPPIIKYVKDASFYKAIQDPVIVHFTGLKPWNMECRHPLRNLYYHYRESTIWKDSHYMENFKYKRIKQPFFIQLKLFIYYLLHFYRKRDKMEVQYKSISLIK